jgi:hypothetical protein
MWWYIPVIGKRIRVQGRPQAKISKTLPEK